MLFSSRTRRLDQKGQALTEYLTLLILVALVAVGGAQAMGKLIKGKIATANRHIDKDINFNEVNR